VHAEDVIGTTVGIYRGDIEKCALSLHSLPIWMPDVGVNDHLRAQISSLKIPALNFMPSLLLHELGEWPGALKGPVETVFHLRNSTYVIPSCDAGVVAVPDPHRQFHCKFVLLVALVEPC
jgi:hypothetical protein